MLPAVSRFAPSNAYELMKSRVVERFCQYFDRFVGNVKGGYPRGETK